MSEWKEYRLGEILNLIGGGTPKTSEPNYWNGDIPWLSVSDFNNGNKFCYDAKKKITKTGLKNSSTKILQEGQIIISARGTVGIVSMLGKNMAFNQSCYGIDAEKKITYNDFLYYLLKYCVSDLISSSYGAVFDTITKETFNNITVLLPSLSEQQAIASILSSLDDKIDLLQRQNTTLEKMAETLFRQWFVVEAKGNSTKGKLGDLIGETVGGEWGKECNQGEFSKAVRCIRGTDIADLNNGLAGKTPIRFIKDSKFRNIEPKNGDLILEISGGTENQSTGRVTYINNDVKGLFDYPIIFSNFCRLLRIKDERYSYFLYCYLRYLYEQNEFFNLENGSSGIKNLDYKSLLYEQNYSMPVDKGEIIDFYTQVKIYFQRINQNKKQIRTLTALRDTLLPKLMSGEVKVN